MITDKTKNIIERLKKLIRKQKSCMEIGQVKEAEVAMLAINRLLTEYNLSLEEVLKTNDNAESPKVDIVEGNTIRFSTGAEFSFSQHLAATIAKYNYCQCLFSGLGTTAPSVKIVGMEINVQTCQFLFSFLKNNFTYNGDKYAKSKTLEPTKRMNIYRDFLAGTVAGVHEKFEAEQNEQTRGIIKWNDKAINKYFSEKNVYELTSRPNARRLNASAYYTGRTHGRNVQIAKGIDCQKNNQKILTN